MNQKEAIYEMICENTGAHFLDSGGAYGRQYDRNRKNTLQDFIDSPEVVMTPSVRNGELELDCTKSLFHHLDNALDYDSDLDELWQRFDKHSPDTYWDGRDGTMNKFYQWAKNNSSKYHNDYDFEGEHSSGYTYNEENILSQDFLWYQMGECVFIQSHNGCDARGGYSTPHLFRLKQMDDYALFNFSDVTIGCSNGHYWDLQGGYENTEQDMYLLKEDNTHPRAEVIDGDSSEFIRLESDYQFSMKQWKANKAAYDLNDPLPGMDKPKFVSPPELIAGKVLVKDKVAYCPVCGEELYASCH